MSDRPDAYDLSPTETEQVLRETIERVRQTPAMLEQIGAEFNKYRASPWTTRTQAVSEAVDQAWFDHRAAIDRLVVQINGCAYPNNPFEQAMAAAGGAAATFADLLRSFHNDSWHKHPPDWFDREVEQIKASGNILVRRCEQVLNGIERTRAIVLNERTFEIEYDGRSCFLGNGREFRLMKYLVENEGEFISDEDIRLATDSDSDPKVIVYRLKQKLENGGLADLAGFITSQRGHYRLSLE